MDFTKHSTGTTSVKVHHQPGGQSSFSLSHDNDDDRWGNTGKIGGGKPSAGGAGAAASQAPATTSLWGSDPKEEGKTGDEEKPSAGPGSFTSVKYSGNPPGGKSQITF